MALKGGGWRMTMPQAESVGVWHLQWVLLVSNIYNSCVDTTKDDLVIHRS